MPAGPDGLEAALDRIASEAQAAVEAGASFLVLSDRAFGPEQVPVSPLLAIGCVHHHLVRLRMRSRAALFVDSGEPRELHQYCTLVGFGADGICPYLAFEVLFALQRDGGELAAKARKDVAAAYVKSISGGILKVGCTGHWFAPRN